MIRLLFIFLFPLALLAQTYGPSDTARLNDPLYLQGYWKLAGDAQDYSGHGNHGVWSGTEAYAKGPFGKDVANNNGAGYIECSNTNALNLGTNFTLSLWCKVDALITPSMSRGLIAKRGGGTTTTKGYSIYIYPVADANRIYFQAADGVNARTWQSSNLPFGKWTHLALSCGSSGFISYINGKLVNSNSVPFSTTDNIDKLTIGRIGLYTVTGKTANARVYSVELSSSEIAALYDLDSRSSLPPVLAEQPYDVLPDRNDPTLVGAWLNKATVNSARDYSTNSRNGMATSVNWQKTGADFYTTTSRITASSSDLIGTGDVTVCAVIKPRGWGGNASGRIIDNSKFLLLVDDAADRLQLSSDGSNTVNSTNSSIALNTTCVVAVTRTSAGVVNFYINGTLSGTANQAGGTPAAGSSTYIGNNAANTRNFDGLIKDVRIYTRILSVSEIKRITREMIPDDSLLCWINNGKDISKYNRQITNYKVSTGSGPMRFNGADSYLSTPAFITGDFTAVAWIRPDSLGESSAGRIFSGGKNILSLGSSTALTFSSDGGTTTATSGNLGYVFPQWNHIAISRVGTNVTFYRNGLQVGTASQNAGTVSTGTTLYIGNNSTQSNTFNGLIADYRVYVVKSADWISEDYRNSVMFYK